MDMYSFYTGKNMEAHEYLGCHFENGVATFRTFAPAAKKVSVIGEFNNWNETPMGQVHNGQFWECRIENIQPGMMYKYRIYRHDGMFIDHCDPYGFAMELRPGNASKVVDRHNYNFNDQKWLKNRNDCKNKPLNIYELHLGSWRTNSKNTNGWYTYQEIAKQLVPYVKEAGYNYIEIMPLAEHPCDNSWGYQITGFYSPTARYGTPKDLKEMIDYCHQNDIGVILDFVPVHFAVDGYALAEYDGTCLYEYPNTAVGVSEWGSKNFMHSRGEVQSFLQSCANYWLEEYHFDGLRMDAISNIIYWHGNKERGVNMNAVEFIKYMNSNLKQLHPGIMLIAEDSTSYPNITKSVNEGGLGFDYKWDMGWMNDTLSYFKLNSEERVHQYHKLTFSMMYYYDENFLLPFSHDEVVHGKATILQKMNGQYDGKFPQGRAMYMYMYAHPGKKLNFMGNEFGQLREWDEKREQDWNILEFPIHNAFHRFSKDLSHLYLNNPALFGEDFTKTGFKWIDCHQEEKCIYVFERSCSSQKMVALFNFSDKRQSYTLDAKENGYKKLALQLSSEEEQYGGSEYIGKGTIFEAIDGKITFEIPAFCGMFFHVVE